MSRIGKKPDPGTGGRGRRRRRAHGPVKGPKGELELAVPPRDDDRRRSGSSWSTRPSDAKEHRALHGLTRALLANMVQGVTQGYRKQLELHGVGYKAEAHPKGVKLVVGLSHPVEFPAPEGVKIAVETATLLKIEGIDKELVGQVAAEIRKVRPPEPYKGKGIRYQGEQVRRKAGKAGAK
jgi:large subunit ribosomal protein L6